MTVGCFAGLYLKDLDHDASQNNNRDALCWFCLLVMTTSLAFANDAHIRAMPFMRFFIFAMHKNKKPLWIHQEAVGVFEKIKSVNDPAYITICRHPAHKWYGVESFGNT